MTLRVISTIIISLFVAVSAAFAQGMQMPQTEPVDVSDDEIEQFVDVFLKQQEIQQSYQPSMVEAIEEEGLSVQKFQEIMQAMQMGAESDASDADIGKFESSLVILQEIEEEIMADIDEMLVEEGMDLERFNELYAAIQSNPEALEKAQALLMQRSGMGG